MNSYTTRDLGKYGSANYYAQYIGKFKQQEKELEVLKSQLRSREKRMAYQMAPYFKTQMFSYDYTRKWTSQMVIQEQGYLNNKMIRKMNLKMTELIQKPLNMYLHAGYDTTTSVFVGLEKRDYHVSQDIIQALVPVFVIQVAHEDVCGRKNDDGRAVYVLCDLLCLYFGVPRRLLSKYMTYEEIQLMGHCEDGWVEYHFDVRRIEQLKEHLVFYYRNQYKRSKYKVLDPQVVPDDVKKYYFGWDSS